MQNLEPKFSRLRNFFWPIHSHEHRKLIPMLALFFLISFIYNLLKCMKVTLVVTSQGSGAEVIPFLKVWVVLPAAILLTYFYAKLSNYLSREHVFYTMIALFLGFFSIFLLILYPRRESLELTGLAQYLGDYLPHGLKGLISVIRHWPLSLFYVFSDLWSAAILSMLFWGFANEVTTVHEAKRFYAIFALGANLSGIFSGQMAQLLILEEYQPWFPFGSAVWEQSLNLQLGLVLCLGAVIIALFRWVNHQIPKQLAKPSITDQHLASEASKAQHFSLMECLRYIAQSPYMLYIAILVLSYNIVFNLTDVVWTDQVQQRYPKAADFNAYMNHIASITGIFATLSSLILSGNVIRHYGWTLTALITPGIWLCTSLGFFGCLLLEGNSQWQTMLYSLFQVPVLHLALFFGSAQICLGRAAKYTVFDESKEIAFIPLSRAEQRKGKAVVDGIASRLGKSGGSFTIQILLLLCGNLALIIPYVAALSLIFIGIWIYAARNLGKLVAQSIDRVPTTTCD